MTLAKSISVKLGFFAGEYYSHTELKKKSVELCVLLCAPHFIITITEKKSIGWFKAFITGFNYQLLFVLWKILP